ncbi:helix-turn-helix transcriptional regulator [Mycolicibacterium porcinum]
MDDVMTAKQLAVELGISEASLAQDRYKGTGIPFTKVGSKRIRYLKADVMAYLEANRMTRTDDPRDAA